MSRRLNSARSRRRPLSNALLATVVAGLAVFALTGLALAKTFTLGAAHNAKVTNAQNVTKREAIAINTHGRAVYDLVPETIHHALCTSGNMCLKFWFPVTVSSAKAKPTTAPGIKGKLGIWHRNGFFQVTLGGHPLYTFIGDSQKNVATGDTIKNFGGIWHVILAGSSSKSSKTTPPATTPTTPISPIYPTGY
jgi:predicted lipoprotein with Yx(FWY)xxD motif